ncbi:MAG: adenylate/guanylate cyclase domain-containing protein [Candidatus Dormibacteria bacterium]
MAETSPVLLDQERLAQLSGMTIDDVRLCASEHAINSEPGGGYRGLELVKLQLIKQVADNSGGLEHVLRRYREGGYTLGFLALCLPTSSDVAELTYGQALEEAAIPVAEMENLLRAAGLVVPAMDALVRPGDLEAFRQYALIRALPIPAEARMHALRISAEGLRRAAEVQTEVFQRHVVDPILAAYEGDMQEANSLVAELSAAANPTVTGITAWLYQRFLEFEIMKSVTQRMEDAASDGRMTSTRQRDPVVAFIDLSGFTFLSADSGDTEAAALASHFNDALLEITRAHDGRVVKMLGDGAMLFFDDPRLAVRAALRLVEQLPELGLPAARVGMNRGPIVAQSGDFYGNTINVAARINDYARPHEVLVSDSVLPDGAAGVILEEIGDISLKGVPRPVRLLRARDAG